MTVATPTEYSPKGAMLAKIASNFELPEYVRQADPNAIEPPAKDPIHFARYSPELDYPIHNKAACWLSAARFALEEEAPQRSHGTQERHDDRAFVSSRIVKQARLLGIADDIQTALTMYKTAQTKSAVTDEAYSGYPVRNENEARAAQTWLLKAAGTDAINAVETIDLASKILARLQHETHPEIKKMAGIGGISDIDEFAKAVNNRVVYLENNHLIGAPDELVNLKTFGQHVAGLGKSAETIQSLNDELPRLIKTAAAVCPQLEPWRFIQTDEPVHVFEGKLYKTSAFANIPQELIVAFFSDLPMVRRDRTEAIAKQANTLSKAGKSAIRKFLGMPLGEVELDGRPNLLSALLIDGARQASTNSAAQTA